MANPKLSTLADAFTGSTINTALWSNVTGGAATLDTVNDLVILAQPTVNGGVNTFGSTTVYDATLSQIYAEVGTTINGNGQTRTAFKVLLDANNSVAIRLISGVLNMTLQTAGTTVTTQLATTYDPNAHGWWRLRESGGSWNAEVSADGLNWITLLTSAYTWNATAVTFAFQTSAGATEAAGNVATIQHVNTMLGGPFNINWPTLEEAWAPHWTCNGGDVPLDRYVNVTGRTNQQSSVSRGRQYELDQVRAGEASLVLQNTDGVLDPTNSAGPYFGHIMPYQPYRKRAQWPPTRNLLTQVQATAGDLGGQPLGTINTGNNGPSVFSNADATHGTFTASATAWQGGTVMQFAVAAAAASGTRVVFTPQPAVTPGAAYAMSAQVRNVTASTTIQVQAQMWWLDATQTVISSSTGTAATLTGGAAPAWTSVTAAGTAPSNAAMVYVSVTTAATVAALCSVQVDGWQFEQATAPSTWTCPGVWNGVYGGFVERWPSSWDMGGTYGIVQPTAVDAMALLSQVILKDPLTQETTKTPPRFLYTLGDPSGSTFATDQTGNNPPAPVATSKSGPGSLVFGTQITAANPATGVYTGSSGTVVTLANPNPGNNIIGPASFIAMEQAGIRGPLQPQVAWTRMIAFRYTGPTPSVAAYIWSAIDTRIAAANGALSFYITSSGQLTFLIASQGGASSNYGFLGSINVADGNWHLAAVTYDSSVQHLQVALDGAVGFYTSVPPSGLPTTVLADTLGNYADPLNGYGCTWNYQGDISFAAEWSTPLASADLTAIYTAWKSACAGESTNARYSRILRYAGYIGVSSIQTGLTTSMGGADFGGQDALSALQAVVDTENGEHFADKAGTVTFRSRSARYNALLPQYTFGERGDLGEWPYEDCQLDFDPTHLSNLVQITQDSSNQVFTAQDATSQTNFFPRSLERTINASSTLECQDAGNYLLSRYKNPATRIATLVLHPSANPMMWPMCLALELGMRVRVNRRPPAPAAPISIDCFVENLAWSMDDGGEATLTLQCSPVDLTPYGIFSSFHTTLHTTISSGVTSVTINAGQDSTNLAAAQIGANQQLVLGQNTANQETVTVSAVAATSPGWATCVLTLTAATTKGHTAGDVVCEPLPSGVTDPTTYDANAKFDSVAFSY